MRNYGIINADNGSADFIGIIGSNDARWSDTDLACLQNLTGADFEPVNVQSLAKDWPGTSVYFPLQATSQITLPTYYRVTGAAKLGGAAKVQ